MDFTDFTTWFKTWLLRHPLKAPSDEVQVGYTAEVMEKIRRLHPELAPARSSWLAWPSLSLGAAVAAAAVLLVVGRIPHQALPGREVQPSVVLAESSVSDEQWINQTIQLLDQVDDHASSAAGDHAASGSSAPTDDQTLLEELQLFDESELASSS